MPTPGARTIRTGGNTSCVSVEADDEIVIIDAGTGLRELGQSFGERARKSHILFSHYHWDHLLGLTSFHPLFDAESEIHFYGEGKEQGDAQAALMRQFAAPHFPVPFEDIDAKLSFHPVIPGDVFSLGPLKLEVVRLNHPNGAVGYKVSREGRSIVYASDHEHDDEERHAALTEFARDADVLVYDSTYSDDEYEAHKGWGHSTWQEAIKLGKAAGVKERIVLFHHDPSRDDHAADEIERAAQKMSRLAVVAREGMVIEL
jgi:phosphoribosyl 1,2-cyclic phosphodiesterase